MLVDLFIENKKGCRIFIYSLSIIYTKNISNALKSTTTKGLAKVISKAKVKAKKELYGIDLLHLF